MRTTTLCFDYEMQIRYLEKTFGGAFTLRLLPQDTGPQKVLFVKEEISPDCGIWHGKDAFGNVLTCGNLPVGADHLTSHVHGEAMVGLSEGEKAGSDADAFCYTFSKSPLTQPGEGISHLAEEAQKRADFQNPDSSVTRRAMVLCHLVHEAMTYEKGRTGIHTSAEEALSYHAGVCEDYSHVLIALCRHFHLTARYVTGYLAGEGESHAWVEVKDKDLWVPLDPTNDCRITTQAVRVGVGRDASDCPMNRGIHFGKAGQEMSVHVDVKEKEI